LNRVQVEAFAFDPSGTIANPYRDMDFISGVARGARHRQPVRDEIPVFRNQVENLLRRQMINLWHGPFAAAQLCDGDRIMSLTESHVYISHVQGRGQKRPRRSQE
jgi:hypothetical protein